MRDDGPSAEQEYTPTGDPRSLLWEAMLDADYHARYYGELGSIYERYETCLHFATLLLSAGTVISLLNQIQSFFAPAGQMLGEVLAIGTFAASLWMALKRYGRVASLASYLSSRWSQSLWEYERLWARVDQLRPEDILRKLEEIRLHEIEWDHVARREFHRHPELEEKTFGEMLAERSPDSAKDQQKAAA